MTRPAALLDSSRPETWPLVLTFHEVCGVLRISTRTGYTLRQQHRFPVPELTPKLGTPRYFREDVLQAVKVRSGHATALERRRALQVR
jgi:hypothetical protein